MCLYQRLLSHPSSIRSLETGIYWVDQPFVGSRDPLGNVSGLEALSISPLTLVGDGREQGSELWSSPQHYPLFFIFSPPPLPPHLRLPPPPWSIWGSEDNLGELVVSCEVCISNLGRQAP